MTETTPPADGAMRECCRDFARVSRLAPLPAQGRADGRRHHGHDPDVRRRDDAGDLRRHPGRQHPGRAVPARRHRRARASSSPTATPATTRRDPTPSVPKASLLGADSMFGLHPNMAPLQSLWDSGELAAIQAVGLAVANRSHFSAIEEVEDADPGSSARTGWINRMIGLGQGAGTLDGVQLGMNFPTSAMIGPRTAARHHRPRRPADQRRSTAPTPPAATPRWPPPGPAPRGPLASGAAEAVSISKGAGATLTTMADSSVAYPTQWYATPFAEPLESAAKLIKADLGTDVIAIDAGTWDLHTGYGNVELGHHAENISGLGHLARRLLLRPRPAALERHRRDHQRVRPPGRRERQPGLRPRLGQHDARRRRRGEGRPVLRHLARPADRRATAT